VSSKKTSAASGLVTLIAIIAQDAPKAVFFSNVLIVNRFVETFCAVKCCHKSGLAAAKKHGDVNPVIFIAGFEFEDICFME